MVSTLIDVVIESDGLRLEGVLHMPKDSNACPAVAICHPHPRYGGDMDNNIVVSIARGLCDAGVAALRFNYRGVGKSEGEFDKGVGERQDSESALDWLSLHSNIDASRIGIAGYSFGAWMALEASVDNNLVQAVASIACPISPFTQVGAREMLQPKLLICGEHDHDFPASQFKFLTQRFGDPKEVELIYGADHFFGGHVSEIANLTTIFFTQWLGDGRR